MECSALGKPLMMILLTHVLFGSHNTYNNHENNTYTEKEWKKLHRNNSECRVESRGVEESCEKKLIWKITIYRPISCYTSRTLYLCRARCQRLPLTSLTNSHIAHVIDVLHVMLMVSYISPTSLSRAMPISCVLKIPITCMIGCVIIPRARLALFFLLSFLLYLFSLPHRNIRNNIVKYLKFTIILK